MAMTGVLKADFSEFVSETTKAQAAVKGMEDSAKKTEAALSNMSEGAVGQTHTLRDSFGQVDQVLSASGVNVGKYARGLMEIGDMAGKTASQIGALATGASIFGALMAGWQFGTWIAGWTGLADAVEKYADSLSGLPAEVAAAKQDVINFAIQNGASLTISYTDAIKFNTAAVQHNIAANINWNGILTEAIWAVRGLSAAKIAEIEIAQRAGASTEQLTTEYGLSALALKELAIQQREVAKAAREHQQEVDALEKSYAKLTSEIKNANQMAIFEKDADTQRRREENQRQLDLMERDARLNADRAEFDDREERTGAPWERRNREEQERLDRELQELIQRSARPASAPLSSFGGNPGGFSSVMNSAPSIVINAQGALLNNPSTLHELARLVEDAIAQRSGLTGTFSRRGH